MKSDALFQEIKSKLSCLKIEKPMKLDKTNPPNILSVYNYNIYKEITKKKTKDIKIEEIDNEKLNDLKYRLDYYFKSYLVSNRDFKDYIKIITIYLCFFKKKPFHPVNMELNNEIAIFKKENQYFCSLKKEYENDKNSLCELCIAKRS